MATLEQKLQLSLDSKNAIKAALQRKGAQVTDETLFSEYAGQIDLLGGQKIVLAIPNSTYEDSAVVDLAAATTTEGNVGTVQYTVSVLTTNHGTFGGYIEGTNLVLNGNHFDGTIRVDAKSSINQSVTASQNLTVRCDDTVTPTYEVSGVSVNYGSAVGFGATSSTCRFTGKTTTNYASGRVGQTSQSSQSQTVSFPQNNTFSVVTRSGSFTWNGQTVVWSCQQKAYNVFDAYCQGATDFSTLSGIPEQQVQQIVDGGFQAGESIAFSEDEADRLIGLIATGDKAHWDGNSLVKGGDQSGYYYYGEDAEFDEFTGISNGHKYIDLGLPSGRLWATCNIGADKPTAYGNFFQWGDVTPYKHDGSDGKVFDWAHYKWCNGSYNTQTKYNNSSSYGTVDNYVELLPEDDAATYNMGGSWRMPSSADIDELLNYCTNEWVEQDGVYGRMFTGRNGNKMFIPAAGYRGSSGLFDVGSYGYLWSRSLDASYPSGAWYLYFDEWDCSRGSSGRYGGRSVRGVL